MSLEDPSDREKRIMRRVSRFHQNNDETTNPQPAPRIKVSKKDYGDNPLEATEQCKLASYLDRLNVLWNHCPNERKTSPIQGARMNRQGRKKGYPDAMVYDLAPENNRPTAIELKRRKGGRLTPEQREWLKRLQALNWNCYVAHGADDAITYLRKLGYK
tara:strand:- start:118 stop:594 length:477 start_codon:yes stop_codon:yes gene_type:complete